LREFLSFVLSLSDPTAFPFICFLKSIGGKHKRKRKTTAIKLFSSDEQQQKPTS
jgi:hypothetical protein